VAHYYRGVIHQRQDEPQEALADYEASLQFDPDGDLAEDAAWAHVLLQEEEDRTLEAAAAYQQFSQTHPDSPWAARAAFLSGLIPYQASDPASARAAWEEMLDAFTSPEHRTQAHLWLGQTDLVFFDDREGASTHFQQAFEAASASFYALRAEAWLNDEAAVALPLGPNEGATVATPRLGCSRRMASLPLGAGGPGGRTVALRPASLAAGPGASPVGTDARDD